MDAEVKQRNRRRKRAQRMQQAAQREIKITSKDGDSAEEDSESAIIREKPQRPLIRRKKSKEPLVEEDIIDGFSILGFKSYEDLESVIKLAGKDVKRLLDEKAPRHETRPHITHHISAHPTPVHGLTLTHQDPGTSDDSGRASERLTGSSVAPRDADSSRDRLSDASSRCSSGKGYICDSEGEDDKGSDASSVIFGSIPTSRKHEFPGAVPSSLPLSNGTSNSPVPAPTPPNIPAPTPAPAQQPPAHPVSNHRTGTTTTGAVTATVSTVSSGVVTISSSTAVPITMPQPAAAPVAHHPPAFVSTTNHGRTESPAVATSANAAVAPSGNSTAGGQYHHPPFQPLYTPYAVHSTFSSQSPAPPVPSVITTTTVPTTQQPPTTVVQTLPAISSSHRDSIVSRTASPKVHSPSRERESYSSNVSSLSRSSVTPINCPPPTTVSSLTKVWSGTATRLSPAPPRPTPPLHSSFPSPMFTTPLPPPTTSASSLTSTVPQSSSNPNPFSAENLFQSNQADMLRRELDNRFLASQDRSLNIGPPPYLRAEMHQHQHHHTHVHQHTTSILPPPPPSASNIFPPPLVSQFKEIPKLGGMDSSFYRQNLSLPGYPGYSPSILHSGLTGPTPFVPPNHLPAFQPKPAPQSDPSKPKIVKAGKWNAMHVRIAWEVYHHQQKESKGGTVKPDLLRTPSHLFPPSVPFSRPHEIQFPPTMASHRPPTFEQQHPGIFGSAGSHLGNTLSPFARYGAGGFSSAGSPFSVSPLVGRDLQLGSLHDPWRGLQRSIPVFPPSVNPLPPNVSGLPPPAPWSLKPDPVLEQREREERERAERERERLRREREERERREREEKQRKLEQQQQERERERREKERREHERREMERQQERERMLHQQRLVESSKQLPPSMLRDRSPLRNGSMDPNEIRIKEEPRIKEEDRYHPYVRQHPVLQHSLPQMMDRSRVLPPPYPPPPSSHWPPPPPHADPYYRAYEPLRYNSLMDAAMRAEEERVKLFSAYQHHAQFRPKDPSLLHLRAGSGPGPPPPAHKLCATPPTDLHKKEEPR